MNSFFPDDDNEFGPAVDLVVGLVLVCVLLVAVLSDELTAQLQASQGVQVSQTEKPQPIPEPVQLPESTRTQIPPSATACKSHNLSACSLGIEFAIDEAEYALFGSGSAELSSDAREILAKAIAPYLDTIEERGANNLIIAGYASPTPMPIKMPLLNQPRARLADGNLDLSSDRANAIAHVFAAYGVSYSCMQPSGLGRTRSPEWQRQLLDKGLSMAQWDTLFLQAASEDIKSPVRKALEEIKIKYQQKRRVALNANYDEAAACSSQELVTGLKRFIAGVH